MVDRPGFEPGTSRVQTERSSRLSYRPTEFLLIKQRDYISFIVGAHAVSYLITTPSQSLACRGEAWFLERQTY